MLDEESLGQIILLKVYMQIESRMLSNDADATFTWLLLTDKSSEKIFDSTVNIYNQCSEAFMEIFEAVNELNDVESSEDASLKYGEISAYMKTYLKKRDKFWEIHNDIRRKFADELKQKKGWKSMKPDSKGDIKEIVLRTFTPEEILKDLWASPDK